MPIQNAARYFDIVAYGLYRLSPEPDLYVFLESDSTDRTLEVLDRFHRPKEIIQLDFPNRPKYGYEIIAKVRQRLLERARELGPDYAIYLDSDVRVRSEDLIARLTSWGKEIVGASYLRRMPIPGHPEIPLVIQSFFPKENMLSSRDLRFYKERGPLLEVAVAGAGCLCLSRTVVDDSRLNWVPVIKGSEDESWCQKATDAGYKIYLDTTILLDHYIGVKKDKAWK